MKYSMVLISFLFSIVSTSCHAQDNLKTQTPKDISDVFPEKVEKSDVDKYHSEMVKFEKSVPKIQMIHTNDWNAEQGTDIPSGTLIHAKILVGNEISLRNGTAEPLVLEAESVVLSDKNIVLHNCRIIAIPNKEISINRLNAETNTISCLDKKGDLFESSIHGYLADTDNISGIKGNITNLAEGINSLPKAIQQNIKNARYTHKNSASDEVAQWYLEQMKATLPILTINSGKKVNVITTKEIVLKNI